MFNIFKEARRLKPDYAVECYLNNAIRFILDGKSDNAVSEILYALKGLGMEVYEPTEKKLIETDFGVRKNDD